MADYTVRVELYRASDEDYARLDTTMEKAGFSRFVTGGGGACYQLPTGEYSLAAPAGESAWIQASTRELADAVKPNPRILVTEAVARAWSLPRA